MSEIDPVEFGQLKGEVSAMRSEMHAMRSEMNGMRGDISKLLEVVNKSQGAYVVWLAVAGSVGAFITWAAQRLLR